MNMGRYFRSLTSYQSLMHIWRRNAFKKIFVCDKIKKILPAINLAAGTTLISKL